MVIIGAGGLAKELLQVYEEIEIGTELVFFDNVTHDLPKLLYQRYRILTRDDELQAYFATHPSFVVGVGVPRIRKALSEKALKLGGKPATVVGQFNNIGKHVQIGPGATVLSHVDISNGSTIGDYVLIYYKVVITHDCRIGNFVELSPGATLLEGYPSVIILISVLMPRYCRV